MRELSLRHQVIAVEVIDPRELRIPNVGTVLLQDPESGETRELNTASRKVRARYAAAARLQRQLTAANLRRPKWGISSCAETATGWLTLPASPSTIVVRRRACTTPAEADRGSCDEFPNRSGCGWFS